MESLFVILLCAHVLGDFVLQTDDMVQNKRRFPVLLLHSAIHAGTAYLLLQQWRMWELPVVLMALHFLIDWCKLHFVRSPTAFALDQTAHVLSLLTLAWWSLQSGWANPFTGVGWTLIVVAGGFSTVVWGSGFFVGEIAQRIMERNKGLKTKLAQGLFEGGKQIGQLERALIFLLILINQPAGIGFLVAAKSVLRFKEAEDQTLAEYILIGTLWSFTLAIALSWLTTQALFLHSNLQPLP